MNSMSPSWNQSSISPWAESKSTIKPVSSLTMVKNPSRDFGHAVNLPVVFMEVIDLVVVHYWDVLCMVVLLEVEPQIICFRLYFIVKAREVLPIRVCSRLVSISILRDLDGLLWIGIPRGQVNRRVN